MKSAHKFIGILISVMVLFLLLAGVVSPPTAQAQAVQVLSADPNTTAQGTVNLNVLIKGKGFKRGALAKFLVTGTTDTGGVRVNSTTYVDASTLTANIDVADTAVLSKYDIQVMNSDGRGGKGTELFAVTAKASACFVPEVIPTAGYCFGSGAGCLDPTFGGGTGRVLTFPGMWIYGVAVQNVALPDGGSEARIVAVGQDYYGDCALGGTEMWTVIRYLPDGTLDPSFGTGGIVRTKFLSPGNGIPYALTVQSDNKLLVAGSAPTQKVSNNVPAVVRYNPNGSLDSSFGVGGIVTLPYNKTYGSIEDIVAQSDGKIVAVGIQGSALAVLRLNPNGSLDTTFNGTGRFLFGRIPSRGTGVAIEGIGNEQRIVVAGYTAGTYNYYSGVLLRFTLTGMLDTTFGGTGEVLAEWPPLPGGGANSATFKDVAVDPNNRIVVVGNLPSNCKVGRYDMFGNLDTSFGTGGFACPQPRLDDDSIRAVAVQPDARMLVLGSSDLLRPDGTTEFQYITTWRFNEDGSLDATFGDNGLVRDTFAVEFSTGQAIVLQPDFKFIVAGLTKASYYNGLHGALARHWR